MQVEDGREGLASEREAGDEVGLADLVGVPFDHEDAGVRDGDDEVHVGDGELIALGEGDKLTVDAGDADGGDGAAPGDVGQGQGEGGGGDREGRHVDVGGRGE